MQDRFKFRVYHKPTNKIYNVYGFNDDFVFIDTLDTCEPFFREDCILLQCLGLKDKNGKLIYEDDIVAKEFSDRPFSSKAKHKIKNCLVYWHKSGQFSIKYNSDEYRCYSAPYDSFIGDCEVVGNIHENPDLLEKEDE